jgi:hypothetical protein
MKVRDQHAVPLRVVDWIDAAGRACPPLTLANMGAGHKVLFCFQHACPACHQEGFPVLGHLIAELGQQRFGFAAIQTVFEDFEINTCDKLALNQARYDLSIPFGHDPAPTEEALPSMIEDYHTQGTPWFILINPDGFIIHSHFRISLELVREIAG